MQPWPGTFTTWRGKNLKILKMTLVNDPPPTDASNEAVPGTVRSHADKLIVRSEDGWLVLEKIQLAGKRAMQAVDFARGRPEFIGSVLGEL